MIISEIPLRFRLSNIVPPQNMKHGAVEGGESPSQTQFGEVTQPNPKPNYIYWVMLDIT